MVHAKVYHTTFFALSGFFAPRFWDGFHWTVLQCTTCALTGAVAELIMEVIFSPMGYRIIQKWRAEAVGKEYLDFMEKEAL